MISFKQFLNEGVVYKWTIKKLGPVKKDIPALYDLITKNTPQFPKMLSNGGILVRGWQHGGREEDDTFIIDTSTSHRTSRDTNNFYQVCMDYSPALKGYPSRTNSLICGTHPAAALQHGEMSVIIPFGKTPIAAFDSEDMFFHTIMGESFEQISNFIGNFYTRKTGKSLGRAFELKDVPKLKQAIETIQKTPDSDYDHFEKIFYQFKENKFDSFINKYFTPRALHIKKFKPGDVFPVSDNSRKSDMHAAESRNPGNEVWFSGEAFSVDLGTWNMLVAHAKKLGIKVHPFCEMDEI